MIRKLLTTLCLLPMVASAQQSLRIEGQLTNLNTDTLLINSPAKGSYDTIVVRDGAFVVNVPLEKSGDVTVFENYMGSNYMRKQIALFGLPGEKVTINGTFDNYQIGGSSFYQQLNNVMTFERPFKAEEQRNIIWGAVMRSDTRLNQEEVSKQFHQKRTDILNRREDASVKYMQEHSNDEAALLLLDNIRDPHKGRKAFNSMTSDVQNGRMADYARPFVERYDAEIARLKVAEKIKPGKPAPLFTLNDMQGKPLSLKSLRGKYVILDFWGSWCFWCLAGVPQMKNYYDKYHGKFEILGIDCNDTVEKWKDAVEKNQMNWQHVQNTKNDKVPQQYAVSGYPTKVIINPNGTINQVFIGEKEEFYQYLDKLFGKK